MLGNVYLLHGQPNTGKTILGNRLYELLTHEHKNWRRSVFKLDENDFYGSNFDVEMIAQYIHTSGCDIVIINCYPSLLDRQRLASKISDAHFVSIYLYCTIPKRITANIEGYDIPSEDDSIYICTNRVNSDFAYNELVTKIKH